MDKRIRALAEQVDAGLISRREFLRRAAAIAGGSAVGLQVLGQMAHAQARPKMRVWLFKSFVTDCNDILAKHIETWAKERKVEVVEPLGAEILLDTKAAGQQIVARVEPAVRTQPHEKIRLTFVPDRIHFFDAKTEAVIK